MSRACYELSNYQRLLIGMAYTPCYKSVKIMESTHEKMTKAQEIALKNAKIILAEAGITKNDKYYSIRLYEMQFKIYHELKLCLDIPTE